MQYVTRGILAHGYIVDASTKPPTAEVVEFPDGTTIDSDDPRCAGIDFARLVKDGVLLLPSEAKPVETQAQLEAALARTTDLENQLAALKAQLEAKEAAPVTDVTFQPSGEEA